MTTEDAAAHHDADPQDYRPITLVDLHHGGEEFRAVTATTWRSTRPF